MENVRRFAFAGERGGWIAFQKAPAASGRIRRGRGSARGAQGGAAAASDRPKGTDLILRDLSTGARSQHRQRRRVRVRQEPGKFLALVIDAPDKARQRRPAPQHGVRRRVGRSTATRRRTSAWRGPRRATASPSLKGTEDKRYKDKVYAAIGFADFGAAAAREARVYDPATDKTFPEGMSISPNRGADVDRGPVGARLRHPHAEEVRCEARRQAGRRPARDPTAKPDAASGRRPPPETPDEEKVDLVLWHYKDPRLQSQQQVQEADGQELQLPVRSTASRRRSSSAWPTTTCERVDARAEGQVRDRQRRPRVRADGQPRRPPLPGRLRHRHADRRAEAGAQEGPLDPGQPSPDGTKFSTTRTATTSSTTWRRASRPTSRRPCRPRSSTPRTTTTSSSRRGRPLGWTKDGDAVLLSDGWDIWKVPVGRRRRPST